MTEPVRYLPDNFPPGNIDWARLVPLIGRANAALARYDGLIAAMPNVNVLLSPLISQEAVMSSQIEGTNVTMSEALEIEIGAGDDYTQHKRDDAEEIRNYRRALTQAADETRERPMSLHLIRGAHAVLMQGVRGKDKDPGAFRTVQNWIGPRGCTIDQAQFIPVSPEQLPVGLERWMNYVRSRDEPDPLVQLAIIHHEFEALHPFKDGNGRLGRMIIPLFLCERSILSSPNFYMSGYLEARRDRYIAALQAASRDGAWTEWCEFFLEGVFQQAIENQNKAGEIQALHDLVRREVAVRTRSRSADQAVDFIFSNPIFTTSRLVKNTGMPSRSAQRLLQQMVDDGFLDEVARKGAGRLPKTFRFPQLLDIVEDRQAP